MILFIKHNNLISELYDNTNIKIFAVLLHFYLFFIGIIMSKQKSLLLKRLSKTLAIGAPALALSGVIMGVNLAAITSAHAEGNTGYSSAEAKYSSEAKSKAKPEAEAKAEAKSEVEAVAKPEAKAEAESEAKY